MSEKPPESKHVEKKPPEGFEKIRFSKIKEKDIVTLPQEEHKIEWEVSIVKPDHRNPQQYQFAPLIISPSVITLKRPKGENKTPFLLTIDEESNPFVFRKLKDSD